MTAPAIQALLEDFETDVDGEGVNVGVEARLEDAGVAVVDRVRDSEVVETVLDIDEELELDEVKDMSLNIVAAFQYSLKHTTCEIGVLP